MLPRTSLVVVIVAVALYCGCGGDDDFADEPVAAYCDPVADSPMFEPTLEDELVELINAVREEGTLCNGVPHNAAPPVVARRTLKCAARVHTEDMVDRDYYDHTNPEGQQPGDRVLAAGYPYYAVTESLLMYTLTSEDTMQAMLVSENGHCEALMDDMLDEIGVAHRPREYDTDGTTALEYPYWTLLFATRFAPE